MHADRDDAPFKTRKQSNPLTWGIALAIGTGITMGLLSLASMSIGKKPRQTSVDVTTISTIPAKQTKTEKKSEIDWDRVVEKQARRDAAKNQRPIVSIDGETEERRLQAENERKANTAIAIVNAQKFGEGATYEPKKQKQTITVIGKQESKISDFCPGGEGSITRRNCKQRTNLSTRF